MPQQYSQTMRAFAAERPRRAMLTWLVAGILAAAWLIWFVAADVTVRAASEQARLEVAVAPSGIDTMVAGEVMSNALVLGREVKKGEVLLEIDARRETLLRQQEKSQLAAARAKRSALAAEIATRRDGLRDAQAAAADGLDAARARAREAHAAAALAADDEARIRTLAAKGVAPRVGVKKAAAEHQKQAAAAAALDADIRRIDGEAKAEANAARADIERLNVEASDLAGEIAASEATIERLSIEIARHVLRAPVDGRLADVASLHTGSHVNEGQRLALVVPAGRVQVIADFAPSPVLGRVHPGQRAELHLDGFPWSQYGVLAATVRRVDSEVHDRLIRVELDLDAADAARPIVQHGLPGSVSVAVEQTTPAVLLLRAAGVVLAPAATSAAAIGVAE